MLSRTLLLADPRRPTPPRAAVPPCGPDAMEPDDGLRARGWLVVLARGCLVRGGLTIVGWPVGLPRPAPPRAGDCTRELAKELKPDRRLSAPSARGRCTLRDASRRFTSALLRRARLASSKVEDPLPTFSMDSSSTLR